MALRVIAALPTVPSLSIVTSDKQRVSHFGIRSMLAWAVDVSLMSLAALTMVVLSSDNAPCDLTATERQDWID
jgi:hypothetical protein